MDRFREVRERLEIAAKYAFVPPYIVAAARLNVTEVGDNPPKTDA